MPTRTSRETTGPCTELPLYLEVYRHEERGDKSNAEDNYRVALIIRGTRFNLMALGLDYSISKKRANELAIGAACEFRSRGLEIEVRLAA